jgi:hypothetical protein
VSEDRSGEEARDDDRAAARRDVDAGMRDRMAEDDMPDAERDARRARRRYLRCSTGTYSRVRSPV